jgi:cyclically-permuted mutarotase family protein
MNRLAIFIITILMFLTAPVVAQIKQNIFIQWEIAGELPADSNQQHSLGFAGPVTGIHNDVFFIAGGANFPDAMPWEGGKKFFYNEVYVYTRKQRKLVPLKKSFILPSTIAYPACCNTPKGVLYAGGENENGISNKVWLMQWDAINQNVIFRTLPSLPVPVSNAAATLAGHTVYIVGGETAAAASSQLLALDLNNTDAGWKQLTPVPQPVSHTVLTASSGKTGKQIYLLGGRKKNSNGISDLYSSVFEFNIQKNQWTEKAALPYALCAGIGTLYNSNYILMFGGDKGVTFHKVEILVAAINAEKDETKKRELILQKNKLQAEHPGFSKEVLLYNTKTNTWITVGNIPFDTPVTTIVVKWGSKYFIPSGEIKAGVRSPNILSAKILPKAK